MGLRHAVSSLAFVLACAGGFAGAHFLERQAQAKPSQTATVVVPPEGLAFRTTDGHLIARLSYDGRGGLFEVYDKFERPTGSFRPASMGGHGQSGSGSASALSVPDRFDLGF